MARKNLCQQCGKEFFKIHNPNRVYRFCSKRCSGLSTNTDGLDLGHGWNKGKIGLMSWMNISGLSLGRAWNKGLKKQKFCKNCGNPIIDKYNQNIYCSIECFKNGTTAEKHYNWLGGITPEIRRIRNQSSYLKWARDVKKRDGYRCQICGEVGGILNSHHIKTFSKFPELRFELNNGITLCKKCHDTHTHKQEEKLEGYFYSILERDTANKEETCPSF